MTNYNINDSLLIVNESNHTLRMVIYSLISNYFNFSSFCIFDYLLQTVDMLFLTISIIM